MVNVNFFNENGNVSVKVRENIRKQVLSKVLGVLENSDFEGVQKNANGGVSIQVANTLDGEPIYAHFEMTVNTKSPDEKTEKSKGKKKAATVEEVVPDIFG